MRWTNSPNPAARDGIFSMTRAMPATLHDPDCPVLLPMPVRGRRRKGRRAGKLMMIVFASLWVVGCVIGLCYAFSAIRVQCAACPECIIYPP